MINAILIVKHTLTTSYYSQDKLKLSFAKTGLVKLGADHLTESTVDWDILMSRTYSQCEKEDMDKMMQLKEQVKADMRQKGKTTSQFCDEIGVPKNEFDQNRDDNIISKQDIQSLNHDATLLREMERKRLTAERTNPALIAIAKETLYHKKNIFKQVQKRAAADRKAQRENMAATEKRYIASLNKEDKATYMNQKKVESREKKSEATRLKLTNERITQQRNDEAAAFFGAQQYQALLEEANQPQIVEAIQEVPRPFDSDADDDSDA